MDNYQKVEQLVNKTGCSYEDAKAVLEECGWDMLDSVIKLEKEGKISKVSAEQTSAKAETVEIIPEIASYDDNADDHKDNSKSGRNTGSAPKREFRLWKRIKSIVLNNRMVMFRSNGTQIMDLPILVPIIALIACFWATLIIAVIAMLFGCRFHFEGEDLGKTNINSTMDKATDYAEKVKNDLSKKANGEQNTDN